MKTVKCIFGVLPFSCAGIKNIPNKDIYILYLVLLKILQAQFLSIILFEIKFRFTSRIHFFSVKGKLKRKYKTIISKNQRQCSNSGKKRTCADPAETF